MSFFDRLTKPLLGRADGGATAVLADDAPAGEARQYKLDTVGQVCPFPLVEAKQAIKGLKAGDELIIDFDCTQATDAIPQWCATDGHEVTDFKETGEASWQITVKKG